MWVYDNAGVGETDCIFVRNTNRNDIRFYSCNYTSKWDTVAFMEAAHTFSFFDTALYAVGTNSIIGSGGRSSCFAAEGTATGSTVRYHGGTLICSNTAGAIITGGGGVKYELHNVGVTNRGTSTSFVLTTGDVLVFDGTSVTSGEIDDDFGSGVALWRPGKYVGEYYGDGAGLTNIPSGSVNGALWFTNATSGKVTNILGGVSVGANSITVSNGTASFMNILAAPATPRWMVGGNQGAFTTGTTNSIAGTNGSGFFVHDSSGNSTNNGNIQSATLNTTGAASFAGLVTGQNGAQISGSGNSVSYRVNNSAREVYLGGTSEGSGWAVKASGTSYKYAATIPALSWLPPDAGVDIGSPTNVVRNVFVTNLFSTTVTATNGLFLPQLSGIPSSVDLRSSSGNTNWLALNLGGDVALLKTNPAAASSYLTNWLTVQLNFVEGSTAGTSVSLTTATAANITSVALTPGTWDLTASIYFDFVGATVTFIEGAFNTTSATIPGPPPEDVAAASPNVTLVSSDESLTIPRRRVTITANTTYYLVGRAAFSAGSIDAYGKILATRVN